MKRTFTFLLLSVLTTSLAAAKAAERTQKLHGVQLESYKKAAERTYTGSIKKTFDYPLSLVKNSITNFGERCNNDFKSWRQFSSEELDCKYHNEFVIEAFSVPDFKKPQDLAGEIYLLGRRTYNRGNISYYELVQVTEALNEKQQRTVSITSKMLTDQEVRQLTEPKFSNDSSFDQSSTIFKLTEISPSLTQLEYSYTARTDHWLMNKEVLVPQVFASISKSINELLATVEEESSLQKRKLASED